MEWRRVGCKRKILSPFFLGSVSLTIILATGYKHAPNYETAVEENSATGKAVKKRAVIDMLKREAINCRARLPRPQVYPGTSRVLKIPGSSAFRPDNAGGVTQPILSTSFKAGIIPSPYWLQFSCNSPTGTFKL